MQKPYVIRRAGSLFYVCDLRTNACASYPMEKAEAQTECDKLNRKG